MRDQSFKLLSDIIGVHSETGIGLTVHVEDIPSDENVWILPKSDTFTL